MRRCKGPTPTLQGRRRRPTYGDRSNAPPTGTAQRVGTLSCQHGVGGVPPTRRVSFHSPGCHAGPPLALESTSTPPAGLPAPDAAFDAVARAPAAADPAASHKKSVGWEVLCNPRATDSARGRPTARYRRATGAARGPPARLVVKATFGAKAGGRYFCRRAIRVERDAACGHEFSKSGPI